MATSLPFIKFFPSDWLGSAKLRAVSLVARGVWIEVICVAWSCDEPGVLASNGKAWSLDDIARRVNGPTPVVVKALQELLEAGVAQRRDDGALFCPRTVKDRAVSQVRAEAGRRGAAVTNGLPGSLPRHLPEHLPRHLPTILPRQTDDFAAAKHPAPAEILPPPRSQKPDAKSPETPPTPPGGGGGRKKPESLSVAVWIEMLLAAGLPRTVQEAAEGYHAHRRTMGKPITRLAASALIRKLVAAGPDAAAQAMLDSVANGWQGCFPDRSATRSGARPATRPEGAHRTLKIEAEYAEPDASETVAALMGRKGGQQ